MKLNYIEGDATEPQGDGNKLICHCCNNVGVWGSGFVVALSRKWKEPEEAYHKLELDKFPVNGASGLMGHIQYVGVAPNLAVVNIIGQYSPGGLFIDGVWIPPIDYRAMHIAFAKIKRTWLNTDAARRFSLHAPRLGCDRAGGKWERIAEILDDVFNDIDIEITIYDLPKDPKHDLYR